MMQAFVQECGFLRYQTGLFQASENDENEESGKEQKAGHFGQTKTEARADGAGHNNLIQI